MTMSNWHSIPGLGRLARVLNALACCLDVVDRDADVAEALVRVLVAIVRHGKGVV